MREFTIPTAEDGSRLTRWLQRAAPGLTKGLMQKYLRQKDIKVNGRPAKADCVLQAGDSVRLYLPEELFVPAKKEDALLAHFHPHLNILYEDQNLMVIDKRPGLLVHPDQSEKLNTLVTHVRAYLYQKGEYDSLAEGVFSPVPVNRIDRFTSGIVLVAKTKEAMQVLNRKIRDGELSKRYLCIVHGRPRPENGQIKSYLQKNAKRVTVLDSPAPDAQLAVTRYQTLSSKGGLSLVECELLTGRTHQIRAQLASRGHPLLGDKQYGGHGRNERGEEQQALCAYRLVFTFQTDAGPLEYLKGRSFTVSHVPFLEKYFPEYDLNASPQD